MVKLVILILAAAVGAAALAGAGRARAMELTVIEGLVAPVETAPERKRPRIVRLRVCMGPARIAFGGGRPIRVSFGGEGCGRNPMALFAVAIDHPERETLATRL